MEGWVELSTAIKVRSTRCYCMQHALKTKSCVKTPAIVSRQSGCVTASITAGTGRMNWTAVSDISVHLTALSVYTAMLSVLWRCWLGVRKSIRPVKIEWWCVGVVMCLEWGADCLHIVQLMPLPSANPIISCLILIQSVFTLLLPAYPGCPGQEAVNRV